MEICDKSNYNTQVRTVIKPKDPLKTFHDLECEGYKFKINKVLLKYNFFMINFKIFERNQVQFLFYIQFLF